MSGINLCAKLFLALFGVCATVEWCVGAVPEIAVPAAVAAAIADPARPAEQVARDAARRPAEALAFAGVAPDDRVADFMSGGAYFTRIFSRVVGNRGRVYAFLPEEELKNCAPEETAGTRS